MYYLCKIRTNDYTQSLIKHPLDIIMKSDDLAKIGEGIEKRIKDGCPVNSLLVFKHVDFEFKPNVIWDSVSSEESV